MTEAAEAWHAWRAALAAERLHHAWLLSGPQGSGKASFALAAAAELVGASIEAASRHHPDIILLRREAKDPSEARKAEEGKPFELTRNITVAQIRAMQQRLTTRPSLGERRAIIIDPADDLETGASNALLKTLEEPPAGTVFLLIAHQPARLLPTIRSRCRVLRFAAMTDRAEDTLDEHTQLAASVEALLEGRGETSALLGKFAIAVGFRPTRQKLQAALREARRGLTTRLEAADKDSFARIDAAHSQLCQLDAELATYNYDADLLAVRIGTLLSGVTAPIDTHDA